MKTNPNDVVTAGWTKGVFRPGLTKREYFTTQALAGICASDVGFKTSRVIGRFAVEIADQTIKALNEVKQ